MALPSSESTGPQPMRMGGGKMIFFKSDTLQIMRKNWSFKQEIQDVIKYSDIKKVDVEWACFKGILKVNTAEKTIKMSCSKKMLMDAASYIYGKSQQEDFTKDVRRLPRETKKKLEAKPHPTVGITDAGLMLKRTVNPCKSSATFVSWEQIVAAHLDPTMFRSGEIVISTSIIKADLFIDEPVSLPKPAPKPVVPKKKKRCSCCSCFACCKCCKKKKPAEEPKEEPKPEPPKEEPWGDVDDDFAAGLPDSIIEYETFVIGGKLKELEEIYEILMPQIGNGLEQGETQPIELLAKGGTRQLTEVRRAGLNIQNSFCCGCWGWERIFLPWHSLLSTKFAKCSSKCIKTGKMDLMAHGGGKYTLKKVPEKEFIAISELLAAQVEPDKFWMDKVAGTLDGYKDKSLPGVAFDDLGVHVNDKSCCTMYKTFVPWAKVDTVQYKFGCFGGVAELITWSSRKIPVASGRAKSIWAIYDKVSYLKYKEEFNVKEFNVRRNKKMSCSYSDSTLKLVMKTGMFSSVVKEFDLARVSEIIWKYRPDSKKKLKDLIIKVECTKKKSDLVELIVFPLDKKEDAEMLRSNIAERVARRKKIAPPMFDSPKSSGVDAFEAAMAKVDAIEKKEEKTLQETLRTVEKEISIFDKYKTSPPKRLEPSSETFTTVTTTSPPVYSTFGSEKPGDKLAAQLQKLEADIAKREPSPRPDISRGFASTSEKTEAPGAKLAAELQKLEADIARREPSPRPEIGRLSPPTSAEGSKPSSPGTEGSSKGGLYGRNIGRLQGLFENKTDKPAGTTDPGSKMSAVQERAQRILNEAKGSDTKPSYISPSRKV